MYKRMADRKISFRAKLVLCLIRVFGRLPLRFWYAVGGVVAWVLSDIMHYRRLVIISNIARAFPEKSYDWVQTVAKRYYKRMGDLFAEAIWFGGCTGSWGRKRLRKSHIYEYVNSEVMGRIRKERGIMSMTAHSGNWEIYGGIYCYDYRNNILDFIERDNVHVAYKRQHDKVSDEVFYQLRRSPLLGYQSMVETKDVMRDAIRHKDDRPMYIMIADQYPYKAPHPVGTFLNQETVGMLGGFSLAVKLGFAVLYQREERVSRGHYKLSYEVITEDATGQDPEELMKRYFELLEADIQNDPVNWLWSHKRWRRPKTEVPYGGNLWKNFVDENEGPRNPIWVQVP